MSEVINITRRLITREISLLREFLTTPRGIFETVDDAIKIAREELQAIRSKIIGY